MIQTATTIKTLVETDPTATAEEKKALLNALRGNKPARINLISKKAVAAILDDCSTRTVDRLSERGYLHPIKFSQRKVRFSEAAVLEFARTGIEVAK